MTLDLRRNLNTNLSTSSGHQRSVSIHNHHESLVCLPVGACVRLCVDQSCLRVSRDGCVEGCHSPAFSADHPGLLKQFASGPSLLGRLKTFVDLNLHYIAFESRAFHLDLPYALPKLFRSDGGARDMEYLKLMATRLATTCLTLGEKLRVRFMADSPHSGLNEALAAEVEAYLNRVNPEGLRRGNSELIILDRSVDACALLVHEYTYQVTTSPNHNTNRHTRVFSKPHKPTDLYVEQQNT